MGWRKLLLGCFPCCSKNKRTIENFDDNFSTLENSTTVNNCAPSIGRPACEKNENEVTDEKKTSNGLQNDLWESAQDSRTFEEAAECHCVADNPSEIPDVPSIALSSSCGLSSLLDSEDEEDCRPAERRSFAIRESPEDFWKSMWSINSRACSALELPSLHSIPENVYNPRRHSFPPSLYVSLTYGKSSSVWGLIPDTTNYNFESTRLHNALMQCSQNIWHVAYKKSYSTDSGLSTDHSSQAFLRRNKRNGSMLLSKLASVVNDKAIESCKVCKQQIPEEFRSQILLEMFCKCKHCRPYRSKITSLRPQQKRRH